MNRLLKTWRELFRRMDPVITGWMARHGIGLIRVSLGVVFLWFGALKFFPGLSDAETLAARTIGALSFGRIPPSLSLPGLATWESLIGLGLLTNMVPRLTLLLLYVDMLGTLTPLVLFPHETFKVIPLIPTLEGQYIIKNLVLISAGIVIGATVRGGRIVAEPGRKRT
ncbi:MAG: hypothetical protein A3F68_08535 [Acidobacteria bacterium RIFCSPLOWO2_12_FULL_54_10]|nr:MAG: hypothetical protein A3F68_08535 [Acidobacteria bacterium RIFCSPLOWO2_12_FULL_54_10]